MKKITIVRGHDGFGSQILSIISGIAYTKTNNMEYQHSNLTGIKLVGMLLNRDEKIMGDCNKMISTVVKNLNIKPATNECSSVPFYHNEILNEGVDNYYNESFLKEMQGSYGESAPTIYDNGKFNIAIHIRRGDDILPKDKHCRWIDNTIYENLINNLLTSYSNSIIHIFSWNDPELNVSDDRIRYHITNDGSGFLNDFNCLVHADLLVVGSSTFSLAAGFFNKNVVMCDKTLCKISPPIPTQWVRNFKKQMFYNMKAIHPEHIGFGLSFKDKLFILYIAKNGSTTIRRIFNQNPESHSVHVNKLEHSKSEYKQTVGDMFSICFIRDPLTRAVSVFLQMAYSLKDEKTIKLISKQKSIEDKFLHFFKHFQNNPIWNIHFLPQYSFYDSITTNNTFHRFLLFDNMNEELIKILDDKKLDTDGSKKRKIMNNEKGFNITKFSNENKRLTDFVNNNKEVKNILYDIYKEDFDLYKKLLDNETK